MEAIFHTYEIKGYICGEVKENKIYVFNTAGRMHLQRILLGQYETFAT